MPWHLSLQKLDPFLADLRQASSLLQTSIQEFEKGDPPGGVQVSLDHGVGKPPAYLRLLSTESTGRRTLRVVTPSFTLSLR